MAETRVNPKPRASRDPSRTIKRIIEAAREEFGANGFDGAKMEHIARRAGVSKQLVYFYFNGKDELYGEVLKLISLASYEWLLKIDFEALEPEAAIRTYIETIYDQYLANPIMAVVTMDQSLHGGAQIRVSPESKRMREKLWQRLSEALERGKRDGIFSSEWDVESLEFMTVIVVSGCVSSRGMFTRYLGRQPIDEDRPERWRDHALTFILRALRA
jgi:TetR/AcrR family transcriptional regulator